MLRNCQKQRRDATATRRRRAHRGQAGRLQAATAATTLLSGRIRGDGRDILDTADLESRARESAHGGLSAGAGGLGGVTTSGTKLDVDGGDAQFLETLGDLLGSHHSGVRGALVAISLHLHTTGATHQRFATGQICDVNEGVIERGEEMANAEAVLSFAQGRAQLDGLHLSASLRRHLERTPFSRDKEKGWRCR